MLSGFYTAASGMLMNQRRLNVISNNMANQKTPGYQSKKLIGTTFEKELIRQQNGQNIKIGKGALISVVDEEAVDFTPGSYEATDRPYDMALNGGGFFVIQGDGEQYLTRNGNFDRDEEGYLALRGVGRVMGENGPIRVNNGFFNVAADGTVYGENGNRLGRIQVSEPADYNDLVQNDNGTYTVGGNLRRVYPEVQQGMLESSNVDVGAEITNAMDVQRAFQSCGKALSMIDQMNQKTASEIGKI